MKFLIFNVIVFCALGYLLTSKPNENFNQWISNTKNKISNISKDEVISTIKKATKEKKEIKDINKDLVKESTGAIKNNKNTDIYKEASIETKYNKNSQNKNNNYQIREIIKEILDEKKQTKFDNKKFSGNKLKEDFNIKIADQNYKKELEKQSPKINFMSLEERENALAELITDMELYHLNNLAN